MKAILYTKYGYVEAFKVENIEKPSPVDKQVLVKVRAASINASDWRRLESPILSRLIGGGLTKPKDTSMGSDLAGEVEAVGANVTQFKPGDEVFGCGKGTFAEYALARETFLVLKPIHRSFEEAAAVPVAGLTALQAIRFAGGIRPADRVLIQGASGGVGLFAVQLAKVYGAEVTGVCSPKSLDTVRSAGADHVIDYTQEDFTQKGEQYDLILGINGYHPLTAYKRSLSPGGKYICVGGNLAQIFQSLTLGSILSRKGDKRMANMGIAKVNQEDLAQLAEALETGKIAAVIDRSYPLNETAEAVKYVFEEHPRGKVVITIS